MGLQATRVRIAGILSLCLLLLSSLGATSALGAAAPSLNVVPQAAATLVFGSGSCVGTDACLNAVGPIGDHACIGNYACQDTTGSIASESCDANGACSSATGTIGAESCNGLYSCGNTTSNTKASVGDNSCNGTTACTGATGATIGDNSCNHGETTCFLSTATIGDYSCNGLDACIYQAAAVGNCANNKGAIPLVCGAPKPDARVRKGTGAFAGNNIYNTTGNNQARTGAAARGSTITFGISVQNDATILTEKFTVLATGSSTASYVVTYFNGTTDITSQVESGSYTTPAVAPGATFLITATVKVRKVAIVGSSVTRLVTVTSVGDGTKKDAVKFTGKRS
jgi:hypothetical protein